MKVEVSQSQSFALISILGENGAPASPQNPISAEEYSSVEFPEANGSLAVVSGMPASAVALVACYYKNLFSAIAIANPRAGVAEVIHSVTKANPVGSSIPLN